MYILYYTLEHVCVSIYTLEDLKWDKPTKNQKGLLFTEHVNFGFGSASKLPDDLLLLDK